MTWYIYRLVDPRNCKPFYVGLSIAPRRRLLGHMYDPASAGWPTCRELRSIGLKPILEFVSEHDTRDAALIAEWELIMASDGLVNRSRLEPWPSWARRNPEIAKRFSV